MLPLVQKIVPVMQPLWKIVLWFLKKLNIWGTGVVHSVKHPTFGFGSGHDLRVVRLSPAIGTALDVESA